MALTLDLGKVKGTDGTNGSSIFYVDKEIPETDSNTDLLLSDIKNYDTLKPNKGDLVIGSNGALGRVDNIPSLDIYEVSGLNITLNSSNYIHILDIDSTELDSQSQTEVLIVPSNSLYLDRVIVSGFLEYSEPFRWEGIFSTDEYCTYLNSVGCDISTNITPSDIIEIHANTTSQGIIVTVSFSKLFQNSGVTNVRAKIYITH